MKMGRGWEEERKEEEWREEEREERRKGTQRNIWLVQGSNLVDTSWEKVTTPVAHKACSHTYTQPFCKIAWSHHPLSLM